MKGSVLLLALVSALSASAAIPQPKSIQAAASQQKTVRTKAFLSGVEENETYRHLPPVMVELNKLPRGAAVWVEVNRGGVDSSHPSKAVESKFFLRKESRGVLAVPGIQKACSAEGLWTVSVLMSDAKGTTVLSRTTFSLQSNQFAKAPAKKPVVGEAASS